MKATYNKQNNTFVTEAGAIVPKAEIPYWAANLAKKGSGVIYKHPDGKWRLSDPSNSSSDFSSASVPAADASTVLNSRTVANPFAEKLQSIAVPNTYKITPIKWKYLIRNVMRSINTLMVGPSGCGKTAGAIAVAEALQRPFFKFNLGSSQDPRTMLLGNTQYDSKSGTFFNESDFIKAIQTPDAIVLLDEVTRANPEAENILMTVLDPLQRYLRIDERVDGKIVKVDPTVAFIGTANVGTQYTATRRLDRATLDRFQIIEVDMLDMKDEKNLLLERCPGISEEVAAAIAGIAEDIRAEANSDTPKLSETISHRASIEIGNLIADGFTLEEAADVRIYPLFDDTGSDSERTLVKQIIQKYAGQIKKTQPTTQPQWFKQKPTQNTQAPNSTQQWNNGNSGPTSPIPF